MAKFKYVCAECGQDSLSYEASVIWNYKRQQYEIQDLLDYCYCTHCDQEARELIIKKLDLNTNITVL